MSHRILDIIAEDPHEPHIADQVQPAAMHEHGGQDRMPAAALRDVAPQIWTDLEAGSGLYGIQQIAGD